MCMYILAVFYVNQWIQFLHTKNLHTINLYLAGSHYKYKGRKFLLAYFLKIKINIFIKKIFLIKI